VVDHGRARNKLTKSLLVRGRFFYDGLCGSIQLHRTDISGLGKPAQGSVTTNGTFYYFIGDNPSGAVFLAAG
jgi:hypothetical protein